MKAKRHNPASGQKLIVKGAILLLVVGFFSALDPPAARTNLDGVAVLTALGVGSIGFGAFRLVRQTRERAPAVVLTPPNPAPTSTEPVADRPRSRHGFVLTPALGATIVAGVVAAIGATIVISYDAAIHHAQAAVDSARAEAQVAANAAKVQAENEGFVKGHAAGLREGEASGKAAGVVTGRRSGAKAACLWLFRQLNTDRIYNRPPGYFGPYHYYNSSICNSIGWDI